MNPPKPSSTVPPPEPLQVVPITGAVGAIPPPLSPEQLMQLAQAQQAARKIRRAVSWAIFDGWTIGIFAAGTLACGFFSATGLIMGAAMGAIAFVELRSAEKLRRLDARAGRTLAINQLALAGLLIAYAVWSLLTAENGGPLLDAAKRLDSDMAEMIQSLTHMLTLAIYGGLIAVAILAQGSMALFYFRRVRLIEQYLASTPPWVVELQRAGVVR